MGPTGADGGRGSAMTDPAIHEELRRPIEERPPGSAGGDDFIMRHLTVGATTLKAVVPEYFELRRRRVQDGIHNAEVVWELAGMVAAVLRSARRQTELLYVVERESELSPLWMFETLDQLLHSLVLLTDEDEYEFAMEEGALQAMLDEPDLKRYLDLIDEI